MHGEDDHLVDEVQAVDDLAEPRLLDVRLAVDRGDDVRARLVRDRERGARDGTEEPARVGHHVAHDVEAAEHALVLQRPLRAVVGAEEEPRDPVDLDARVLLGHGEVAAAKTGLDVRDRNRRVRSRPRSCQRRVRVAVHEDDVGLLARDPCRDLRLHPIDVGRVQVEPVARLREPELVEEDLRHDVEPVLPRVQDDLVEACLAHRRGQRRGLDELRPVADDGEDLHGASNTTGPPQAGQ